MRANSMRHRRGPRARKARTAFTLIELLVVISIISVLISLLLPGLAGARRTGQRVACMGGLRQIAKGMQEYATDNDGWPPGSPYGSGFYLMDGNADGNPNDPVGIAYGQSVQVWDFMGPLAEMWGLGLRLPSKNDVDGVKKRFDELRSHDAFLCQGNAFLAFMFAGPSGTPTGWMVSYNTQRYQLLPGGQWWPDHGEKPPASWKPSVLRIGVPAEKIFCGDGARYSTVDQPPDFDLTPQGPYGGAFSDTGTYSTYSRSWDRSRAPGNGVSGAVDARAYAFRHATAEPPVGARGNAFKANFAFYDGSVRTMGDLESSSPYLWLPTGSKMTSVESNIWADTRNSFGITGDIDIGPRWD